MPLKETFPKPATFHNYGQPNFIMQIDKEGNQLSVAQKIVCHLYCLPLNKGIYNNKKKIYY